MASNSQLRKYVKSKRESLSQEEVASLSSIICNSLLATIDKKKPSKILIFSPFRNEVDISMIFQKVIDLGYELYFPKTSGDDMTFLHVRDLNRDFSIGNFGIQEPNTSEKLVPEENMLCITPGLVFDENCNRLGFGRGFYDRFFASSPKMLKVGVAYDFQIMDGIEVNDHDVPLDCVITERRIIHRLDNILS